MMKDFKGINETYNQAKELVSTTYDALQKAKDGFEYITSLRCYGDINNVKHNNEITVQELCDQYYGDNGIVDVYTNNSNHNIVTYGTVYVVTNEKLLGLSKDL